MPIAPQPCRTRPRGCRERTNTLLAQCWSLPIFRTSLATFAQRRGLWLLTIYLSFSGPCDAAVVHERGWREAGTVHAIQSLSGRPYASHLTTYHYSPPYGVTEMNLTIKDLSSSI